MSILTLNSFHITNNVVVELLTLLITVKIKYCLIIVKKKSGLHKGLYVISVSQFRKITGFSHPLIMSASYSRINKKIINQITSLSCLYGGE